MPGARCTRSLICKKVKAYERRHREVHRFHPAFPHAMVLTVSSVIFPVIGFVVTVASGILPARLTPASRRQNHTTSPSAARAVRQQHVRVHRIPSRVRDDRERPLVGRDQIALLLFLPKRQAETSENQKFDSRSTWMAGTSPAMTSQLGGGLGVIVMVSSDVSAVKRSNMAEYASQFDPTELIVRDGAVSTSG